jgi:GAF domain-containing protein/DNA-binding CsgD family transcriptional regulator
VSSDHPIGDRRLALLSDELASAAADVDAILSIATSTLSQIKPALWVALVMDSNPDTSRVVVADDTERAMAEYVDAYVASLDRPHRAPTVGISQQVIEAGTPIINSRMSYEDFLKYLSPTGQAYFRSSPPPRRMDTVGLAIVPMRVGGSTIGTLGALDWRQQQPLVEADLEWLQSAADRVALSVEYARLLGTAQDQADRMDLVRAITLANTHARDLQLMLRVIVEQATARLDVDAADILLVAEQGKELELAASAGFRSTPAPHYRIPTDSALHSAHGQMPQVGDVADLDRKGPNPRRAHLAREGFQTMLTVPLHTRNRLVGVLELFHRSPVEWEQDWLNFFDTLGGLAGVAIDHASSALVSDMGRKPAGAPRPSLSDLELEILRLIADGLTNREIAEHVHRSENTIKFHVRRILEKSGASNRTDLARRATREGWL